MQNQDEIKTNLLERLDWRFARRNESRVARQLWKKRSVDAIYNLEDGGVLDEFFHFLDEIKVLTLWQGLQGEGMEREMIDFFQYVMLYGMKTLYGIEAMDALPALLFSDEAAMRLAGFNATQVRQGICRRSQEKRKGDKAPGPICPDTPDRVRGRLLANNIVKLVTETMEEFLNGTVQAPGSGPGQALAKAGVFPKQVTGILDGTDLETTEKYEGCGQVTRKRKIKSLP